MSHRADIHFRPRPGTDFGLAIGDEPLLPTMGHRQQAFLDHWVNGLEVPARALSRSPWSIAAKTCGVTIETLERIGRRFGRTLCDLCAMGVPQHPRTHRWIDSLSLTCCWFPETICRPGCGPYPLRPGHNNVQPSDMGAMPIAILAIRV